MTATEAEINEAHREKMARIKAAKDRLYASKTRRRACCIVHTGTGKGKSTAAWGLAMRCLGHGLKLGVVQFVKGRRETGERFFLSRFPGPGASQGDGRGLHLGDPGPRARHRGRARRLGRGAGACWPTPPCTSWSSTSSTSCCARTICRSAEVVDGLQAKRPDLHVVVTGRNARPELIEAADLVTEMTLDQAPLPRRRQSPARHRILNSPALCFAGLIDRELRLRTSKDSSRIDAVSARAFSHVDSKVAHVRHRECAQDASLLRHFRLARPSSDFGSSA